MLKIFLLSLYLGLFSWPVMAQELSIVTEDFPPFNYQQDGITKGLSSEVVQAVMKEAGVDARIVFYPWARAYMLALHQKNHLIYSIARIPERENLFHWVGSISPYQTSFYKLKKRTDINITNLEEAKQYLIGVSLADVITIYLQEKGFSKLAMVPDDTQNIHKLLLERIDLIAYEENSFLHKVHEQKLDPNKFERVFRLEDLSDELYMALSKTSDLKLFNKLRIALRQIKKKGIYEKIHLQYFKCQRLGQCN
ncbi:MAG: transporter substrate-binding domain-containing protein [Bermanella sp.]